MESLTVGGLVELALSRAWFESERTTVSLESAQALETTPQHAEPELHPLESETPVAGVADGDRPQSVRVQLVGMHRTVVLGSPHGKRSSHPVPSQRSPF